MDKKQKAKLLIRDPDLTDEVLDWYFELIEQAVLQFTHREDIPHGLGLLIVQIVADYANARYSIEQANLPNDVGNTGSHKTVASITRGDTTISYGSSDKAVTSGNGLNVEFKASDFVHDYENRLRPYRKLKTL